MRDDQYQYVLELRKRETDAVLGQVPIHADWMPIEEYLSFALVRKGLLAEFSQTLPIQIEPEWPSRGVGPQIRGVRASGRLDENRVESIFVPIDYFRPQAQRAADQFVKAGQLQAGELFEYQVLAFDRPPNSAAPPARFVVQKAAAPVAITPAAMDDFMDRALLFGAGPTDDVPVFIPWTVLEEVSVLTRQAGALETGGILIGYLHRDTQAAEFFLEITAQVPADARSELTRLSFTPQTWSNVQAAVAARARREIWLGWWHSHSFFKQETSDAGDSQPVKNQSTLPFFSTDDQLLHRTVFPRAYSQALLITDSPRSGMSWTMFGWRSGTIAQRGFHVIGAPLPAQFPALRGANHAAT